MFIARFDIEELLVGYFDLGGVALGDEVDGDEGVGGGTAFPVPGEGEFLGRVDNLIGAYDGVDVAAYVMDGDAVVATDAQIDVGDGGVLVGGTEPLAELAGVGPCREDAVDGGRVGVGD